MRQAAGALAAYSIAAARRRRGLVVVAALALATACGEPPRESPPAAGADREVGTQPLPVSERGGEGASADARGVACIRGGSTRDEVRRIMGEPDSISFGAWLYGRSEVSFGYGVVVDFTNRGELTVC